MEQQLFRGKCSIQTQTAVFRLVHTFYSTAGFRLGKPDLCCLFCRLFPPHRGLKFSTGGGAPCNLTPKLGLLPEHRTARTSSPKSFDEENRYILLIQVMLVEPDPTNHLTALSVPLRFHNLLADRACYHGSTGEADMRLEAQIRGLLDPSLDACDFPFYKCQRDLDRF